MPFVLTLLVILLLCPSSAPAQTAAGAGTVNGVVRDSYGDGLPDAEVILTNDSLGFRRRMETTLDGVFDAAALPPGSGYRLKVSRREYAGWESAEFSVPLGRAVSFEITLPEAAQGNTGASVASARMLAAVESGISTQVDGPSLESLPVRTGDLGLLALLVPTVRQDAQGEWLSFLGRVGQYPVVVDGVATENTSVNYASSIARRASSESVQGLEVLTYGYPAQIGGSLGGAVNLATRGGSNSFHGSLYDNYRNEGLTGTGRFALGRNLAGRSHRPGARLGGPLVKDRLFFFASFEEQDAESKVMNRVLNPLIANPAGTSVDLSNCKASTAQCAAAARFLEGQMNVISPASLRSVSGLAKIDLNLSRSHRFQMVLRNGRWKWPEGFHTETVSAQGGLLHQNALEARTLYSKLGWTAALSPTAVNEMSLGTFRERFTGSPPASELPTGALRIHLAEASVGAAEPYRSSLRGLSRNQFGNHLRVSGMGHTVQFGLHWSQNPHTIQELHESHGAYWYPTLTEFARDYSGGGTRSYTYFTQTIGQPDRKFRTTDFNVYVQDTWRFLRRLAITGGLRWDWTAMPAPLAADPGFYQTGTIPEPSLAFSPRVGAAWALDDRTVVRFGFGIYYAPFATAFVDALYLGNGRYQTSLTINPAQSGAPLFPNIVASPAGAPAGSKNLAYALSKIRYSYSPQTTVSVERRLGGGWEAAVRYLSNPGYRLHTLKDVSLGDSATSRTYTVLNASGGTAGLFPAALWTSRAGSVNAHVYEVYSGGNSSYQAMLAELKKGFSHGVTAQASYAWSHAISNTGGPWVLPTIPASTYNGKPELDRGNTGADQRHRLVLSWNWEPALPSGAPAIARTLVNGWQQSAILTLASGLPATALAAVAGQQFTGVSMAYTSSLTGSGGWARVPFYPVNSLRNESQSNLDLRVSRAFSFTERVAARLALEVFNLFDNQPSTAVNNIAFVASGGTLSPVRDLGAPVRAAPPRSAQLAIRLEF